MSVRLMAKVWELDLPPGQMLVALALADHGDDDGWSIYPSQGRLAWKTGYSERQVRTILRRLEEVGLLVKVAEPAQHRPAKYRMVTTAVASRVRSDRRFLPLCQTSRPEVCDIQTGTLRHPDRKIFPPNHQKNHQEKRQT